MKLSRHMVQPLIAKALQEDLGSAHPSLRSSRRTGGDITTNTIVPPGRHIRARIIVKASGAVAGTAICQWVFDTVDRRIQCTILRRDGQAIRRGQTILRLRGPAHGIFAAERTALNLLGHLSGIATLTQQFVRRVRPYRVKILDTRKTLPGLRLLEKYAVRVGGGKNHRLGLYDAVLIKTNHLNALGQGARDGGRGRVQSIQEAIAKAKRASPGRFVEIEVISLREYKAALVARPNAILLDNWPLSQIRRAVQLRTPVPRAPRPVPLLEVSGGITLRNVRAIAKIGVERISIGQLTHSAPMLNVSLEVL